VLETQLISAGYRHNYLYSHSPGGIFNVILFTKGCDFVTSGQITHRK